MPDTTSLADAGMNAAKMADSFRDPYLALTGGLLSGVGALADERLRKKHEKFADETYRKALSEGADPFSVAMPAEEMAPHLRRAADKAFAANEIGDIATVKELLGKIDEYSARPINASSLQATLLSGNVSPEVKQIAASALNGDLVRPLRTAVAESDAVAKGEEFIRENPKTDILDAPLPASSLIPQLGNMMNDIKGQLSRGQYVEGKQGADRLRAFLKRGSNATQFRNIMSSKNMPDEAKQIAADLYTGKFFSDIEPGLNPATNPLGASHLAAEYPGMSPKDIELVRRHYAGGQMNDEESFDFNNFVYPQLREVPNERFSSGSAPSPKMSNIADYAVIGPDGSRKFVKGQKPTEQLARDRSEVFQARRDTYNALRPVLSNIVNGSSSFDPRTSDQIAQTVDQYVAAAGEDSSFATQLMKNDVDLVQRLFRGSPKKPDGSLSTDPKAPDYQAIEYVKAFGEARQRFIYGAMSNLNSPKREGEIPKMDKASLLSIGNGAFDALINSVDPQTMAGVKPEEFQDALNATADAYATALQAEYDLAPATGTGAPKRLSLAQIERAKGRAALVGFSAAQMGSGAVQANEQKMAKLRMLEESYKDSSSFIPRVQEAKASEIAAASIGSPGAELNSRLELAGYSAVQEAIARAGVPLSAMTPSQMDSLRAGLKENLKPVLARESFNQEGGIDTSNPEKLIDGMVLKFTDPRSFNTRMSEAVTKAGMKIQGAQALSGILSADVPDNASRIKLIDATLGTYDAKLASIPDKKSAVYLEGMEKRQALAKLKEVYADEELQKDLDTKVKGDESGTFKPISVAASAVDLGFHFNYKDTEIEKLAQAEKDTLKKAIIEKANAAYIEAGLAQGDSRRKSLDSASVAERIEFMSRAAEEYTGITEIGEISASPRDVPAAVVGFGTSTPNWNAGNTADIAESVWKAVSKQTFLNRNKEGAWSLSRGTPADNTATIINDNSPKPKYTPEQRQQAMREVQAAFVGQDSVDNFTSLARGNLETAPFEEAAQALGLSTAEDYDKFEGGLALKKMEVMRQEAEVVRKMEASTEPMKRLGNILAADRDAVSLADRIKAADTMLKHSTQMKAMYDTQKFRLATLESKNYQTVLRAKLSAMQEKVNAAKAILKSGEGDDSALLSVDGSLKTMLEDLDKEITSSADNTKFSLFDMSQKQDKSE